MSSKHDLSVNISCNKASVASRGKSPPKRPKLGRQSDNFFPNSSTSTLTTDDTVFCSTPKNGSCARARFGTGLEQLTPIRGFLGISVQGDSADRNSGRKDKDNSEPSNHEQSIRAGPNLGKLHLWDVQKKLEFSDRELETEQRIFNRVTGCKSKGRKTKTRDSCPEIDWQREFNSENTEQKEKERHLKQYHQQLQQLMPSFDPSSKHLLSSSTCQSFSCSDQVPQFSTSHLRHFSQNSVSARNSFDLETDLVPLRTKTDRKHLSSITSERLCIHNNDKREVGHGGRSDTSKDLRVLLEDRKSKYGKERGNVEKERTLTAMDEEQFLFTEEYRRAREVGKRRRAWETPADTPQVNTETPRFEASTADIVPSHTESACYCLPAEHPLSPTCAHPDTLKAPKQRFELSHELKHSTRAANLPTSTSSRVKREWVVVNDSKILHHTTCNNPNEYKKATEPFSTFCSTEDSAYHQLSSYPDTDGKTFVLSQGKADFSSDIMDPLSISLLEVDQQVATASFLQGKERNSSLCNSGRVDRNACNNSAFSISQSTSESVQTALPIWHGEERSNHPSNISVQQNTLSESHIDESNCDFQIRPRVHLSTLEDMYLPQ